MYVHSVLHAEKQEDGQEPECTWNHHSHEMRWIVTMKEREAAAACYGITLSNINTFKVWRLFVLFRTYLKKKNKKNKTTKVRLLKPYSTGSGRAGGFGWGKVSIDTTTPLTPTPILRFNMAWVSKSVI
jgi:hypothetical protein